MPSDAPSWPIIRPAGDSALLVTLGDRIDLDINRRVHRLARTIISHSLPGIGVTVPGYAALLIYYDPLVISYLQAVAWLEEMEITEDELDDSSLRVEIPVAYGGEYGPDLAFVAEHNHLTQADVVRIHSSREYPVYLMGFTPGFPYLGGLDPAIAAPRLTSPRSLVPGGSVGIAGLQTGIYPLDSPGGWRIIGRTTLRLFDVTCDPPFLLAPGDIVVFTPLQSLEE